MSTINNYLTVDEGHCIETAHVKRMIKLRFLKIGLNNPKMSKCTNQSVQFGFG